MADRNQTAEPQTSDNLGQWSMPYVTDLDLRREALSLAIGWAEGNSGTTNTERLMRVAAEFFAFLKKGEQPDG